MLDQEMQHAIIEKPWEYRIVFFQYDCSSENFLEHSIELWLKKENTIKKLRFIAPSDLKIEAGFPNPTHGMEIMDIKKKGLENKNIWVRDFEASSGSITFYAQDVLEIS